MYVQLYWQQDIDIHIHFITENKINTTCPRVGGSIKCLRNWEVDYCCLLYIVVKVNPYGLTEVNSLYIRGGPSTCMVLSSLHGAKQCSDNDVQLGVVS